MLRARNHDGDKPLHLAARHVMVWSFFGAIETLLTKEDPWLDHGPNKAGETPLYLYVEQGHNVEVLSQMLETCTRPEYGGPSDKFLDKLIDWKKDLIKELDTNGWTPLHYAVDNGDVKAVQILLDKDKSAAYVTANKDEGNTGLTPYEILLPKVRISRHSVIKILLLSIGYFLGQSD
ncbi:hypothetical protein C3L33_13108, partial [Rhododendron williamsianum]